MVKILLITCLLFSSVFSYSQTNKDQSMIVGAPPKYTPEEMDSLFYHVDVEAKFPGGLPGWKNYLERNLRAQAPITDGAKPGIYAVTVQFVVDAKGLVNNVKAIQASEGCPTCVTEAIRIIKKGPKWTPAKHNGKPVKYLATQKISFLMN